VNREAVERPAGRSMLIRYHSRGSNMPWEVTIVGSADEKTPLGQREDVIARISVN
jgi:hypothetical protein